MNTLYTYFFTFICLFPCIIKAQGNVVCELNKAEIYKGDKATITLKVRAKKTDRIVFPTFLGDTLIQNLELLKKSKIDTIKQPNSNTITLQQKYTLTSFIHNLYYIPPFTIQINNKVFHSNSLALKVLPFPIDTLHLEKYCSPKNIAEPTFSWKDFQDDALALLALIPLLFLINYSYQRQKRKNLQTKIVKYTPPLPIDQQVLIQLKKLDSKSINTQEDLKLFYTQLVSELKRYISQRYAIDALEMTTDELLNVLAPYSDRKDELKGTLTTADLVKFAKYETANSNCVRHLQQVTNFIDQTKEIIIDIPKTQVVKLNKKEMLYKRILFRTLLILGLCTSIYLIGYIIYDLYQLTL